LSNNLKLPPGVDTGEVSDGNHTFNELYAHRCLLFIALMHDNKSISWWSHTHHDGSQWKGWIIAGINLPTGSITYHVPSAMLDLLPDAHIEKAPEWDGHNSDDVLERLEHFIVSRRI